MVKVKVMSHRYGHKVMRKTVQETVQLVNELGGAEMLSIFDKDTAIPIEELRDDMEITIVPRLMGG
ncbi:MAG: hypothetical protein KGN01_06805 [Patescibacteria group bacterium]|nr:hypothetical protein [Patescibacteria group bacterium]